MLVALAPPVEAVDIVGAGLCPRAGIEVEIMFSQRPEGGGGGVGVYDNTAEVDGKLRPVVSETTVETSDMDIASEGAEREPEPMTELEATVEGYAATIEPYA